MHVTYSQLPINFASNYILTLFTPEPSTTEPENPTRQGKVGEKKLNDGLQKRCMDQETGQMRSSRTET